MQIEYKTLYAQIVHNNSNAGAVGAPNRLIAHIDAHQQLRHRPHELLTSAAIFQARRTLNKMMKSRFTNGN
ncbi:hypothetical protein N7365_05015 [Pseudomonas sediminis]|uniref:hypothetical protein n=1 Tax=Pseudomonas sediminis TaxID=1691904 RepID=UPI00244D5DC8|nr:hypothetical protein [Pseudomonas sediminis]MDG9757467.1 hypothetical protein [Pseudomonas sediminis]